MLDIVQYLLSQEAEPCHSQGAYGELNSASQSESYGVSGGCMKLEIAPESSCSPLLELDSLEMTAQHKHFSYFA